MQKYTGRRRAGWVAAASVAAGLFAQGALAQPAPGNQGVNDLSMADGVGEWNVTPIFTVGEEIGGYTPPGILDGIGAYELDADTIRVLANHELLHFRGNDYFVSGNGFSLRGARVSYFDVDKDSRTVVASGPAYDTIYDANGDLAAPGFLGSGTGSPLQGFSRFCSSALFEAEEFGRDRGLVDRIYFTGEEDGGNFNSVGGAEWALDPENHEIWALPDLGRGAWENVTMLDTGNEHTVAVLLADDSSPFDADGDGEVEAAPLYLYIGEKDPNGDFPARNGLRGGTLYVWVAADGSTSPADFNTGGGLRGQWVEIDNTPNPAEASDDGSTGFDLNGYPTQRSLWTRAKALGAFGFSRPEDVATNPRKGTEAVLASTGVDTYVGGADTFGTMYTIDTKFNDLRATLRIIYDGDADPARRLRSPDNLDWADDGLIYVQEDEAEEDTLDGEPLFGFGAVNPNEAGIVRMNPNGRNLERIANVNRGVALDASIVNPTMAVDGDFGNAGEWESSGILDVSELFDEKKGTLFLFDVQAHGVEDQTDINPDSRIEDGDLVEGGQLSFLQDEKKKKKDD
jgi:hypothetical protein